ncbi:uncharacterized protein Dana_GF17026, isoform C [Drosophila ananassae]|nr:ras-related protein rab7 isoform X2 [Drosophila ananassae]XP_014766237.1 ras-related protein rab7 isoform X2 [Drosophila ananassae]XP_044574227.1 ras-related protein rab7 isoform X2 [Drosophila ananassae]EDV42415.2 uncharacterized protein Dana_GF17026, isoform A [Drosophila ananassae]KPU79712.1 uncharacterized protein Dana_GF17026, isoform B [Drosophila ananassae]KPU79713.1 uncharacterized protein Dana_GF17026, isoform C [Drosophila ananassae]
MTKCGFLVISWITVLLFRALLSGRSLVRKSIQAIEYMKMNCGKKSLFKVIVIGEEGVGKTSLVRRYVEGRFSIRERNTIGLNLSTKEVRVDDRAVTLQIWDTAGQERFLCLSSCFYRGVDCCVLVFDITSLDSFKSLGMWRDQFLIKADPRDPVNFPFIVLGNKVDLDNSHVPNNRVKEWCQRNNNISYYETSAKEGTNLHLAFKALSTKALKREADSNDVPGIPNTIILKSRANDQKKSKKCEC